ncbi:hypothetical protein [Lacticaseibacillus nasuensis]|uniref:hypothetical protein n=1 Tax=Lacticaseibacillus nasuensis TaxID=944671 RepID=UPI0022479BC7|nr:hypothetical protein [Lacticaseibacillus nasuensis]MCX2456484.1 hypothetical protein [Lacticaseibacillus nasuensis]
MKWLNKFRSPLLWGLLLLMVALLGFPLSHAQAAGSITPPSATAKPATAGPNMLTPDGSIGSQGHFRNYLNWQSATAPQSAATQYAVLTSSQSVNTYVSFYKGGWAGNNFRTALAIGSGSASVSSQYGGTTQAGGNQTNVTAITGSSGDENNIGYKLTAPSVTQPTWLYFQVQYRGTDLVGFGSWVGSTIFSVLVLPSNFNLTPTANPLFTFGTSTTMSPGASSALPAGVTLNFTENNTLPGAWTNAATFTATNSAAGSATGAYAFPQTVPYPSISGVTGTNYAASATGYFGTLADQTVYDGGNAEFKLQLPAGLIASDVKWYVDDKLQSSSGTTLDLNRVSKPDNVNTQTIKAVMTVSKNGEGAFSFTATASAKLTIKDSPLKLSTTQPLVFSGPDQPPAASGSPTPGTTPLTLKLGATTPPLAQASWTVNDPDLGSVVVDNGKPSFVAKDNAQGTAIITASYLDAGQTVYASTTIQVAHLASPATVAPGTDVKLTAPVSSGTTYVYQWTKYWPGNNTSFVSLPSETGQTLDLPNIQLSTDSQKDMFTKTAGKYGVIVRVNGHDVLSNIATIDVSKFRVTSVSDIIFSDPTNDPSTTTQTGVAGNFNGDNQDIGLSLTADNPDLATLVKALHSAQLTANSTGATGVVTVTGKFVNYAGNFTDTRQIAVAHLDSPAGQQLVGSTVTFTAPSSPSGATWTYQWEKRLAGQQTWTPIPGATASTYTTPGLQVTDDGASYHVNIKLPNTMTAISNPATVSVLSGTLDLKQVPDFAFGSDTQPTVADLMNGTYNGSTTDVTAPDYSKVWLMPQPAPDAMILADGRQPAGQSYTVSLAADQFKNADGTPISSQAGTAKLLLNMTWAGQPAVQQTVADDGQPVDLFGSIPVSASTHELTTQITPALAINSSNQAKAGNYSSQLTWTLTTGP